LITAFFAEAFSLGDRGNPALYFATAKMLRKVEEGPSTKQHGFRVGSL
jgi:hypothetical protein